MLYDRADFQDEVSRKLMTVIDLYDSLKEIYEIETQLTVLKIATLYGRIAIGERSQLRFSDDPPRAVWKSCLMSWCRYTITAALWRHIKDRSRSQCRNKSNATKMEKPATVAGSKDDENTYAFLLFASLRRDATKPSRPRPKRATVVGSGTVASNETLSKPNPAGP